MRKVVPDVVCGQRFPIILIVHENKIFLSFSPFFVQWPFIYPEKSIVAMRFLENPYVSPERKSRGRSQIECFISRYLCREKVYSFFCLFFNVKQTLIEVTYLTML